MNRLISFISILVFSAAFMSCSKSTAGNEIDCPFMNDSTIGFINNAEATIKNSGGTYIVSLGSPDTILFACNLDNTYKFENLQVFVSGDIKATIHNTYDPCTCYNFVITDIRR
jgi:hypothetical protein